MTACKCPERQEPEWVPQGSNRPGRLWRYSKFMRGQTSAHSNYSTIHCLFCGACWRTKMLLHLGYLDWDAGEQNISPGCKGWPEKMLEWGREPKGHWEGEAWCRSDVPWDPSNKYVEQPPHKYFKR